jgi:hypothetical protein
MTKEFLYWFFLLLWTLCWVWWYAPLPAEPGPRRFAPWGGGLLLFVLFLLIGLALFGQPIK